MSDKTIESAAGRIADSICDNPNVIYGCTKGQLRQGVIDAVNDELMTLFSVIEKVLSANDAGNGDGLIVATNDLRRVYKKAKG